jgi:hypothetical protein
MFQSRGLAALAWALVNSIPFFSLARAAPILETRQGFSTLSSPQISAFDSYTYFAAAAYCQPTHTKVWDCGSKYFWLWY